MGNTALHWAVKKGELKTARVCLEQYTIDNILKWKSDVNKGDFFKRTPLFIAVYKCNVPMVKLLLCFKANPSIKNSSNKSCFQIIKEQ